MRLNHKIIILTTVVVLAAVVPLALYLNNRISADMDESLAHFEANAFSMRRDHLCSVTEIVFSMARDYQERARAGEFSDAEARRRFLARTQNLRYDGGRGYFWIHEFLPTAGKDSPVVVMHPTSPGVVGRPVDEFRDLTILPRVMFKGRLWDVHDPELAARGVHTSAFLLEMNRVCLSSGEGFVEYFWKKPLPDSGVTDEGYRKLSFVKLIPKWNWVIGSGIYLDDIEYDIEMRHNELDSNFRQAVMGGVMLLIVVLAVCLAVTLELTSLVTRPLRNLADASRELSAGRTLPALPAPGGDELGDLQSAFTTMASAIELREEELRARATELERLNESLQVLGRAKTTILTNVSHELKTPLTTILGYVELLHAGSYGPINDVQKSKLSVCIRNVDLLVTLINEILMLADAASRLRGPGQLVSLDLVISRALESIRPRAEEKRICLEFSRASESASLTVCVDPARLAQVFRHLLANAIKFSPPDSSVTVLMGPSEDGTRAVIALSDFGIGIPPQELERVFDEFYQVDASTTRLHGGMGIGLAIAKLIVEQEGGAIVITSEVGRGTTVSVQIPLA